MFQKSSNKKVLTKNSGRSQYKKPNTNINLLLDNITGEIRTALEKKDPSKSIEEGGPSLTTEEVVAEVQQFCKIMMTREKWKDKGTEVEGEDELEMIVNIINRYRLKSKPFVNKRAHVCVDKTRDYVKKETEEDKNGGGILEILFYSF